MKIEFVSNGDDNDRLTNINVAKAMIEHETKYKNILLGNDYMGSTFNLEDLEEIADHLYAYVKSERRKRTE